MQKSLHINPDKCTGCLQCEMACSYENYGVFAPAKSRIKVFDFHHTGRKVPYTCTQCDEAWCLHACPVEAIRMLPDGGVPRVAEHDRYGSFAVKERIAGRSLAILYDELGPPGSARHQRGKGCGNALPAIGGECNLLRAGRPAGAGQEVCRSRARIYRTARAARRTWGCWLATQL